MTQPRNLLLMPYYIPTPTKLAALGLTDQRRRCYPDPGDLTAYNDACTRAVVVFYADDTIRLSRLAGAGAWSYWITDHTGPVADEAAFDALVAQYFPSLTNAKTHV